MKLEEFIALCNERNWPELISYLSSDIKDLSFKIVASAVIGAYHPDAEVAKKYGLSVWNGALSSEAVTPIISLMTGAVDLSTFTNAFIHAKAPNVLNDSKVAESIVAYVLANRMQLGSLLESDELSEQFKAIVHQVFGDLSLTKAEKESYYKRHYTKQAQETIEFIQAKDKVLKELQRIFDLKPRQCKVSFRQPLNSRGIRTDSLGSPGYIYFSEEVPDEMLKQYVAKLKEYGIEANYYNMSCFSKNKNSRGIQLWDNPQVLLQKFANPKPKQGDAVIEDSSQEKEQQQQQTISGAKAELPFQLGVPAPTPLIKNKLWRNSPLAKRIIFYLQNQMDLDNLGKEISELIEKAVSTYNPKLLTNYFGEKAFNYCLNTRELKELQASVEDEDNEDADVLEYFTVFFISCYLPLSLYYACAKGCLPVAKELFEKLQFKEAFQINLSGLQKHLNTEEKLAGSLLTLAVRSGIFDLVKYIYEYTNATVETCIGSATEETALMVAVSLGHEQMVCYLLEQGGNPNATLAASDTTPLTVAITNKKPKLISLLIKAGAIVTNDEITLAIKNGLDLGTIDLLLQHSINLENPFAPYLIAAVQNGDVALLQRLETHPLVTSFEQIIRFNEQPIDERLVCAAVESGSIEMIRYLIDVKKIDFNAIILQETQKEEAYLAEHTDDDSREYAFHPATILANAVGTNVSFVRYLFEELNLKPSAIIIKELCRRYGDDFKIVAYLLSILEQSPNKAQELRTIAFDSLSLEFLFTIFTSSLVVQGNPHNSSLYHRGREFVNVVAALIEEKEKELNSSEVLHLVQANPEALKGALFYYCTKEFSEHTERFSYLLNHMLQRSSLSTTVDIQNSKGESLAIFAYQQGCIAIVKELLARKANPDLPDNEGQTLLNRIFSYDRSGNKGISLVQDYVHDITHSLRYVSKETFFSQDQFKKLLILSKGSTHGISVKELLENSISKSYHGPEALIITLFIYSSVRNARLLVALLKNQIFLEQYPKFKEQAPSYLAKLEALDESLIPAADKRLKLEPLVNTPTATAPSAMQPIQSPKQVLTIVFDIDGVLAGHEDLEDNEKLYFLRKSALISAEKAEHQIFPGVIELMRYLYAQPNIQIAFFSGGKKERNEELVEKLLIKSLGEKRYKEIKPSLIILSRGPDFGGKETKDLTMVLKKQGSGSLESVILIDDQVSSCDIDQKRNFLHSYGSTKRYHAALTKVAQKGHEKFFFDYNSIFYTAGILAHCISLFEKGEDLKHFLFTHQFRREASGSLFGYEFNPESRKAKKYYEYGLYILRQLNPQMSFVSAEDYAEHLNAPMTQEEHEVIEQFNQLEPAEECGIM